jgi:phenylacetate-CoA ligase
VSSRLLQLSKLRAMMSELAGNQFYTRKFQEAGISMEFSSLDEFFARAPFTFKRELAEDQVRNPPYGTNLTYPIERYTRFCQTSGSTGKPLHWVDTPESWAWMLDCWARVFEAADVTSRDVLFFAFSFGPFLGFWTAFEAAARMGCLVIPGGGLRSAARLRTMLDTGATVLCCTPTYATRLAEVAGEEGIDLAAAEIRRVVLGGEPGGSVAGTRAHLERAWPGARIVDHHGMTESGPVSYSCPARPGVLHVIENAFIAEVNDPDSGHAVPPGGVGELVLTNLGRIGSPVIRLRTGDQVRPAVETRCECGSHDLALEGGILGRLDDMVVVRGVNVYPSAVDGILRTLNVAEYRVEIRTNRSLTELSVQVEPSPDQDSTGLAHRVEAALNSALALRIGVTIVPPGTLPRFEMKAKRWVRL